jgi:hypothetical protein
MSISSKIALAMSADGASFEEVHDNLEKIVKSFAIDFSKWVHKTENRLGYHETKNEWFVYNLDKWITPEELLEMYDKEK